MAFIVLSFVISAVSLAASKDCVIDKNVDFPKIPPLMLNSSLKLILPVQDGEQRIIRLPPDTPLTLSCPGSTVGTTEKETVNAKCGKTGRLIYKRKATSISKLGCQKKPKSTILANQGSCGSKGIGSLAKIGFQIDEENFFEVIKVCFDSNAETTIYSEHTIYGAHITAKDIDPVRPSFKASKGFFNISMNTCYSKKNQLKLMKNLLGDNELAATIIDSHKQYYFAKGHMAPDADFVTEAEQDATYYYINAVPQWQAFNNGNWKYLEMATRALGEHLGSDLKIYSGGWGLLELDDVNGNPVEIFIGLCSESKVVPAPAITWKVVHDIEKSRAVAIVGVNNPHLKSAPKPLCKDICDSIPWIAFNVKDFGHGYTYCCTVEDLRAVVPHVPELGSVTLLDEAVSDAIGGGSCH